MTVPDIPPDEPRTLTEVRAWVLSLSISINELREATANTIDALNERITELEHLAAALPVFESFDRRLRDLEHRTQP